MAHAPADRGLYADLLPRPKQTLIELALLAIRASEASAKYVDYRGEWTEAHEREQDRLDREASDTKAAMLAAFEAAGFDRQLLVAIGDVAL